MLFCFIILIYQILPGLVWGFVLQRFFLSRLYLYSSPESNQWCQANPSLGVVSPVLPQVGSFITILDLTRPIGSFSGPG